MLVCETVKSFINQDYENKECIVIDDGSTKSYDGLEHLIKNHDNIKFVHKKNGGTASALNMGIKLSSGELICECQDDDLLTDSSLSNRVKVFDELEKYNLEVLWTSSMDIYKDGRQMKVVECDPVNAWAVWQRDKINTNTMMWRKSIHDKIGLFWEEIVHCEDQNFKIRCLMECNCIAVPNLITVKYRRWGGNKSTEQIRNGNRAKYTNLFYKMLSDRYDLNKFKGE
jgi:glycosyltransferase involved in cell wall biosynthesis